MGDLNKKMHYTPERTKQLRKRVPVGVMIMVVYLFALLPTVASSRFGSEWFRLDFVFVVVGVAVSMRPARRFKCD